MHSICSKHKQPTFSPDKTKDKRSFALVWSPLVVPPKKNPKKTSLWEVRIFGWHAGLLQPMLCWGGVGEQRGGDGVNLREHFDGQKRKEEKRERDCDFPFFFLFYFLFFFSYITFIIFDFFIKFNFFNSIITGSRSILSM